MLKKALITLTLVCIVSFSAQASVLATYNMPNVNTSATGLQPWFTTDTFDDVDSFTLSFNWVDQGWGNRKGQIFYRIDSNPWVNFGIVADHHVTSQSITIDDTQLGTFPTPSALQFGYSVGGGGGHSLTITNASLVVEDFTPVPEPSTYALIGLGLLGLVARRKVFRK